MGVDLFSKLRGSISLPSPFPPLPFCPSPLLLCREAAPSNTARGSGERCKLPQWGPRQSPGRKRILGAFTAQNGVWWQQCDMSHNHLLIIDIGSDIDKDCVHCVCFITVLQTFCEGPNNGRPSLAKFHEGADPRTLAGSTPMPIQVIAAQKLYCIFIHSFMTRSD